MCCLVHFYRQRNACWSTSNILLTRVIFDNVNYRQEKLSLKKPLKKPTAASLNRQRLIQMEPFFKSMLISYTYFDDLHKGTHPSWKELTVYSDIEKERV